MSALTAKDRELARTALERSGHQVTLTARDGTLVELPTAVAQALTEVLEAAADGERALVLRASQELTTVQAGAVLGVSRPTVVRLIDAGKLSARQVGAHRRLSLGEVIAYREASAARRGAALDRMARQAEDLGLYD